MKQRVTDTGHVLAQANHAYRCRVYTAS